jgi:hypothetical protein
MKRAGKDYNNNLLLPQPQKRSVRDTWNVTKTYFLVLEIQKTWKGMTRQYIKSKSHLNFENLKVTQKPLSSFCITADLDITAVTKAETMMSQLIITLNLSLSSADLFSKYFKVMFPDTKHLTFVLQYGSSSE